MKTHHPLPQREENLKDLHDSNSQPEAHGTSQLGKSVREGKGWEAGCRHQDRVEEGDVYGGAAFHVGVFDTALFKKMNILFE